MKTDEALRLSVMFTWVKRHAVKSGCPSRYLRHYDEKLTEVDAIPVDLSPDYSDPVRLAAEIEALAAVRRLRRWDTPAGLCR